MENEPSRIARFLTSDTGLLLEALLALLLGRYLWNFELMLIAALAVLISRIVKIELRLVAGGAKGMSEPVR